jgi:hypothetical protein
MLLASDPCCMGASVTGIASPLDGMDVFSLFGLQPIMVNAKRNKKDIFCIKIILNYGMKMSIS